MIPTRTLAAAVLLLIAACGETSAERERCTQCGMFVDIAPTWTTGATTREGRRIRFDTPRCLVAWLATPAGRDATSLWVTDYYRQQHIPAREARYVIGSDVIGPMGPDFVPLADDTMAIRFREDHHGTRTLDFADLDLTQL
jgi:nitrous oxide reductase accessory protein NosL